MKGYVGRRDFDGVKVYVVIEKTAGGLDREPLKHLVLHSSTGFEWGYLGSGPADLALAILADHLGEDPTKSELYQGRREIPEEAWEKAKTELQIDDLWNRARLWSIYYHQRFKEDFVAKFAKESWTLEESTVRRWVEDQGKMKP